MNSGPLIKGWCPGALRPMESGDGWLVRIRPPGGMLTSVQAAGVAAASVAHGNGMLDLSSRANLQLRGVRPEVHGALIDDLRALDLVDDDLAREAARNVIVTPFRVGPPPTPALPHGGGREALDDGVEAIVAALTDALAQMPALPGKFGFAVDTGANPVLKGATADIRLERDGLGGLILRPDGHAFGRPVTDLYNDLQSLVQWFLETGGAAQGRGRMAAHVARKALPPGYDVAPAAALPPPVPGRHAEGALVGFAFGQMQADTLCRLSALGRDLRLTPWRMILIAGLQELPGDPALITMPDDPLLRVTACTGAPGCAQALGPTRALARSLAPLVATHLHMSGCTKGCAHPGAADVTLVATAHGYNLIRGGSASDAPHQTDLPAHLVAQHLKAADAPSL